tara:strand:+ start:119 stop:532 length:414 start_codon:yes stop_codon:yes gene_type:complete
MASSEQSTVPESDESTAVSLDRERRATEDLASVLRQYQKLLQSAQIHGEVEQQVGEFSTAVQTANLLQSVDSLIRLSDEVTCDRLYSDSAAKLAQLQEATDHARATEGEVRLERIRKEMLEALGRLETSYYTTSVPR